MASEHIDRRSVRNVSFLFASLCLSLMAGAQSSPQGQNAVWNGSIATGSTAFIDAAAFCSGGGGNCGGTNYNFCAPLGSALGSLPSGGGVVDARGIVQASGTPNGQQENCQGNPFSSIPANNMLPITVLLPAATIVMDTPWTLPNNTRLIGQGQSTRLSPSFSNSAVIYMGSSTAGICPSICSGVSVEHIDIAVDAGITVDGILNDSSGQSSFVNGVNFLRNHGHRRESGWAKR